MLNLSFQTFNCQKDKLSIGNIYFSNISKQYYLLIDISPLKVLFMKPYYNPKVRFNPRHFHLLTLPSGDRYIVEIKKFHEINDKLLTHIVYETSSKKADDIVAYFSKLVIKRKELFKTRKSRITYKTHKKHKDFYEHFKYVPSNVGIRYYGTRP